MKKNKNSRIIVTLECTNHHITDINQKPALRYTTTKNRRNTTNKLLLKKYCPQCNNHSIFKEIK